MLPLYQKYPASKAVDLTTRNHHCRFMALTSPCLLAVCLSFHTRAGKRLRLFGGENPHLLPVVSELGTTVEAYYIRSCLRSGLAAALSRFAGQGEADSFMPASEQSVYDVHNLLPAVASRFLRKVFNPASSATFGTYWACFWVRSRRARYLRYCK